MLYISLLVYLLLRLQFENPNEIYSKVFQIPATYIFDINWSVNISGCPENCSRGKLPACNFIKKETLAQVFSCEFYEIFKNALFTEHLWATASDFFISASNNYDDTYAQSAKSVCTVCFIYWLIHFNDINDNKQG